VLLILNLAFEVFKASSSGFDVNATSQLLGVVATRVSFELLFQ